MTEPTYNYMIHRSPVPLPWDGRKSYHAALNPNPETRSPNPETRNPRSETRNPKPDTRHPKSKTSNPKPLQEEKREKGKAARTLDRSRFTGESLFLCLFALSLSVCQEKQTLSQSVFGALFGFIFVNLVRALAPLRSKVDRFVSHTQLVILRKVGQPDWVKARSPTPRLLAGCWFLGQPGLHVISARIIIIVRVENG